ncbi:hypothetical protein [Helicobacter sp. MIT 05-5294]|uniref:hypothetical protein n=1 Tax=Helicobacter sp. MIT 05-5294 TaxID=1548150 RepID=UPI0010FCF289|nr:hypothetical protein [Helicobacter sp. MIT 05-5294]TLD89285.1 hypothetical protein LS69_001310 [Helicobacter sp. MIT 05-5294]
MNAFLSFFFHEGAFVLFVIFITIFALFTIKNKMKLFIIWLSIYYPPFFLMIYDGEQKYLFIEGTDVWDWYIGVMWLTFWWAILLFLIPLTIYFTLKILSFGIKFLYKKYHQ